MGKGVTRSSVHGGKEADKAARVKRLLEEAQADDEMSAELQTKTEELEKHMGNVETKIMEMKGLSSLEELNQLLSQQMEEAPERIIVLRKEVRAKKKEYDKLKAHWWNIRELAKRGGKIMIGGGKASDDFRKEILKICDTALGEVGRPRTGSVDTDPSV